MGCTVTTYKQFGKCGAVFLLGARQRWSVAIVPLAPRGSSAFNALRSTFCHATLTLREPAAGVERQHFEPALNTGIVEPTRLTISRGRTLEKLAGLPLSCGGGWSWRRLRDRRQQLKAIYYWRVTGGAGWIGGTVERALHLQCERRNCLHVPCLRKNWRAPIHRG